MDGPVHVFQYDEGLIHTFMRTVPQWPSMLFTHFHHSFISDGNAIKVITYDVLNNVTTVKFGEGHLWRGLWLLFLLYQIVSFISNCFIRFLSF